MFFNVRIRILTRPKKSSDSHCVGKPPANASGITLPYSNRVGKIDPGFARILFGVWKVINLPNPALRQALNSHTLKRG